MLTSSPQWFVLGAGSIGCLYAAYLQRAGIATTLLLRDAARLQRFHTVGLTLQLDDVHWPVPIAAQVIANPAAIAAGDGTRQAQPITQLVLCTKAQHSRAAIVALRAQLVDDATIVLLQNGMGVRDELQAKLPHATFIHALSTEGAWQPQRFHVVHAGHGETLVGSIPSANTSAVDRFVDDLSRCGLRARAVDDIEQRLWQKLAVNCVINPLTALQRCRNGELMNLPETTHQAAAICAEISALAAAAGLSLDVSELVANVYAVIQRTAANRSSMLQDIEAGRATEIAYLNGFVVREARRLGLPAPINAQVLDAVLARTQADV